MDERRIYGKKIAIDKDKVRGFYNRQAASSESKMGSVFLGNQSPEVLEQKNSYCKDYILPMLDVKDHTRILDLGCGIGRWAEFVLPNCGCYCGVDFSEEMVRAVRSNSTVCRLWTRLPKMPPFMAVRLIWSLSQVY